jgi:DNA replication and repair protein RecF
MTALSKLEITNFRNLTQVVIGLSSVINIFYGKNGSGKTSLLEAIYHLSSGKSFRTSSFQRVIQNGKNQFSIFGEIDGSFPVGLERNDNSKLTIRYNYNTINSIAELACLLPMLVVNQDSYNLLNDGPKTRRQFIDWGVFHVEHDIFFPYWRKFQRAIQQRNSALRQPILKKTIESWNKELVESALVIDDLRKRYIAAFTEELKNLASSFLDFDKVQMEYYSGWDSAKPLEAVLTGSIDKDIQCGYTNYGPHRADLRICVNEVPAQDLLSRGQQKMLVCVMKLAQAALLSKISKKSIFLIDDLPSELDAEKRKVLMEALLSLGAQIFVTGIELEYFSGLFGGMNKKDIKTFHVKRSGEIVEV